MNACGRFYLADAETGDVKRCGRPAGHPRPLDHGPAEDERMIVRDAAGNREGTREWMAEAAAGRHPGTVHLMRLFAWAHLPASLQSVSRPCAELALYMLGNLGDGPELTAGLRKLREAKDCFVTQAVEG
jgi:hypothetical protein